MQMFGSRLRRAAMAACTLLACGCTQTVSDVQGIVDSGGASAQTQRQKKQAEIPRCDKQHGTVAIYEPTNNWWTPLGLPSPEAVIKVYVMQSGCFKLLDRGKGFDVAQQERALASDGDLRSGSNIGKGQMKAADYVLVPDIVSKNADARGSSFTAIAGALMGGTVGAIVSKINITSKTADVVLTLTDVRSSEQKSMEEGHGEHTDWSLGGGLGAIGPSGGGGVGLGTYQNTDVGQVVMLAYLDAYTKMAQNLGYLGTNAAAASPVQAVTLTKGCTLRADASAKSKAVRSLAAGTMLYPTGNKSGSWWEVSDELGNKGWVWSDFIAIAK
jgi:curli biogenesis system outer membrane secretion channel CsgG